MTSIDCEPAERRNCMRLLRCGLLLASAKLPRTSAMNVVWRFAALGAGNGDMPREGDPIKVWPLNFDGAGEEDGVCLKSRPSFLPLGDAVLEGAAELSMRYLGI